MTAKWLEELINLKFDFVCSFLPPIYFLSGNLLCSKLQTKVIHLMLQGELSFSTESD